MKKNKTKKQVGRPTVMTKSTLDKLREGFLMGFNDDEACAYVEIAVDTLYKYQRENPEYINQKEAWKKNPILLAKTTLYAGLNKEENAKWYLERKKKDEFSLRSEHTGKDGEDLIFKVVRGE